MMEEEVDIWEQFLSVPDRYDDAEEARDTKEKTRLGHFFGLNEEEDLSLQRAKKVWKRTNGGRKKEVRSSSSSKLRGGHTFQVQVELQEAEDDTQIIRNITRFYVVHIPSSIIDVVINARETSLESWPVLMFFHGLNSCAWYCALKGTGLRRLAHEKRCIVIFGQGKGEYFDSGPRRDKWDCIGFGEIYWEIPRPSDDFKYLDTILSHIGISTSSPPSPSALSDRSQPWALQGVDKNGWPPEYCDGRLRIDRTRIYFMGYSNGAMFSANVAIRYGGSVFRGICNMMGGWAGGYPEEGLMDVREAKHPVPMLIVSGTEDTYLSSCKRASELFASVGFSVTLRVLEGTGHVYPREYEEEVWQFFLDANA